jgi:hypothetical protein
MLSSIHKQPDTANAHQGAPTAHHLPTPTAHAFQRSTNTLAHFAARRMQGSHQTNLGHYRNPDASQLPSGSVHPACVSSTRHGNHGNYTCRPLTPQGAGPADSGGFCSYGMTCSHAIRAYRTHHRYHNPAMQPSHTEASGSTQGVWVDDAMITCHTTCMQTP